MTDQRPEPSRRFLKTMLILAIIITLILVIGWYLALPLLGVAVVISAAAWGIVVATTVIFCIAAILFFLIPGIIVVLICLFAFIWLIVAIALFPFLFPFLVPLFIIMLVVALVRRKRQDSI